jgi:DNA-binding transcriptional ArsR family regulator
LFENRDGGSSPDKTAFRPFDLEWLLVIADPIRMHILRSLSLVDEATASDLAKCGPASKPTLRRHLAALTVTGVVRETPGESDGETPGRPAARFSLAPDVKNSVRSVLTVLA